MEYNYERKRDFYFERFWCNSCEVHDKEWCDILIIYK